VFRKFAVKLLVLGMALSYSQSAFAGSSVAQCLIWGDFRTLV